MAGRGGAPAAASARAIAFGVLRRVERGGAYASLLLQRIPGSLPQRETALATELVYGVLRWRLHDERILEAFADRPVAEIDPDLVLLFRLASHQILRLDRVPDRAAVSEAVAAAKSLPGRGPAAARVRSGGAGFLNAVLRRLCREKGALPLPAAPPEDGGGMEPAALAEVLAVLHSHPAWMVRRWIDRFGPRGALGLLRADNSPPDVCVRVDAARAGAAEAAASMAAEGVVSHPSGVLDDFLRVPSGAPHRTRAFREGWIYIMDEASGIIPRLLAPPSGGRVLDVCAAPGGKALVLARMVGDGGVVVAGDLHPARLGLVAANARRMGVSNLRLVAGDFTTPPLRAAFDAVLVDAPCSGSGVFRRDVESRWRLAPADLPRLAAIQRRLLEAAAPLVRPGGRLVYSVCSIEPEEGVDHVARFLSERPEFRRADLRAEFPAFAPMIDASGDLLTLPHRDDLDGFYAAALVRT